MSGSFPTQPMRFPEIPLWAIALIGLGPFGLAVVLGIATITTDSCTPRASRHRGRHATLMHRHDAAAATRELKVAGVTKVELAAPGDLTIVLGETEMLRIEGEPEDLARLTTEVHGDRLTIAARKSLADEPTYHLTVKQLSAITITGSGDVTAPDLKGDEVALTLTGTGDLKAGLVEAKTVQVRLASSGDAQLRGVRAGLLDVVTPGSASLKIDGGEVEEQRITIHGSGDYAARDLRSARATATINGSGEMALWARDSLRVTINGSGRVAYRGQPAVEQRIHGSGEIERLGD
ncbi:MAG TPA: head GIN domain-containing protein [Polyangia bacterium]|jgi:hypothetical protein